MSVPILVSFIVAIPVAVLALFIVPLLTRPNAKEADDATWLQSFSPLNYRPMERLLRGADYAFLQSQAGFRSEIGKTLRSERRQILRMYLRRLTADFSRLLRIANYILVYSPVDRPELAAEIASVRLRFYWAILRAEFILISDFLPLGWVPSADLLSPIEGILAAMETQKAEA